MKKECDCCGYDTNVKRYTNPAYDPKIHIESAQFKDICHLCSATLTGGFYDYPQQHPNGELQVMQTICYIGNVILDEIKKFSHPRRPRP